MKIVFVCTGNLCRSPMAEGMMRRALEERGCDSIEVSSTGTWAYAGHPAMPEAIELLKEMDVDISEHHSRPLDLTELADADLIVAMTSVHLRELKEMAPDCIDKVLLMKELVEIEMDGRDGAPEQRLSALLAGRRPEPRRDLDVDDPIGLPISAYERCVRELQAGVDFLADLLC
jgi:protein-tyrosine-phosphatase